MSGHHFISYSRADAEEFAIKLYDELLTGPRSIRAWLDVCELKAGIDDWDEQVVEAIRACESLIFVVTPDSVESYSICKDEWTRALRYKKPIIPIRLDPDTEMPFRLESRQYIDFTGPFDEGLARLRKNLQWLSSLEGKLQAMKHRLGDAQRDLRRATPEQRRRIQDEIDLLRRQIAHQQHVIENPQEAEKRVEESIDRRLELEREPEKPVHGKSSTNFINPRPAVVPTHFQDRHVETKLIGDALKNDATCLITVVGRGGIGKTAMVCRLLKSLEKGQLPDEGGQLSVDGIVYLSEAGSHRVNVPNLYSDLCQLLPKDVAEKLERIYRDSQASTEGKMRALLEAFPSGRYILLLDNFEDVIDPETRKISDAELDEALRALLSSPQHAVTVIITTRVAPRDLALERPERQRPLYLDKGLPSPDAENILREMDADGKVGLKSAPEALLDQARRRTRGFPKALEALFGILSADRDTSLHEILDDTKGLLPQKVVEVLVGEAFSRLDPPAQMAMQALAVYGHPVTPAAVDYLLQPHLSGVNSAPVLNRLVNMQFARKEAGRYYLHHVDQDYALSRVPLGEESDREERGAPLFTQFALFHRAADYFEQTRTPQESWKTIEDLAPQLAEFELRCAGQDYDTAAGVLLEIDFDYLFLWGHSRLAAQLHESLQGKLSDPQLEQDSAGNLGLAYYNVGQYQKAKTRHEQALGIAREIGDRAGEGIQLGNLGNRYATLGETERAIDHYEQSLEIARESGYRSMESSNLQSLGELSVRQGEWDRAVQQFQRAIQIADEIGHLQWQRAARMGLARAFLYAEDLPTAHTAAETALRYDVPHSNGNLLALAGVITLRQGDLIAARGIFEGAVDQAEALLRRNEKNYGALDNKGLALCGLTLCEENRERIPAAICAYRTARAINKDTGIVKDVLRLFDALTLADPARMLAEVRAAAAGTEASSI